MEWKETQKLVNFIAPTIGSTAYFITSMQNAVKELKNIEEFAEKSGDPPMAGKMREACYTIQCIIDAVNAAAHLTLQEMRQYSEALNNQQEANENFGISFSEDILDLGPEDNA